MSQGIDPVVGGLPFLGLAESLLTTLAVGLVTGAVKAGRAWLYPRRLSPTSFNDVLWKLEGLTRVEGSTLLRAYEGHVFTTEAVVAGAAPYVLVVSVGRQQVLVPCCLSGHSRLASTFDNGDKVTLEGLLFDCHGLPGLEDVKVLHHTPKHTAKKRRSKPS